MTTELAGFTLADAIRLADRGENPRIHPNGFIQLDLEPQESADWTETHHRGHSGANLRLHIWNPPGGVIIPRQKTVNEIHDHVFDMKSHVVFGTLEQQLYKLMLPDADHEATHQRYRAVYTKSASSRLEPTEQVGWLHMYHAFPIQAGFSYTQPHGTLHNSVAHGTVITVMEKTEIHEGDAYADTAQEFAWPYICLSPDPARAWNLSGAMERYTEIEEWDLYQVRLGLDDDVRLRVEGATIWEARVHNSIPADRLWWVGTREPLAAKELA
jgi:hypothetical protein